MAGESKSLVPARIRGKVAHILNSRELVINKGASAGVATGMVFAVLDEIPEIEDPDTKEVIGSIAREKIRVRIEEVHERMAIGRTFETYEQGGRGFALNSSLWAAMMDYRPPVTKVRTLHLSDMQSLGEPLEEAQSYVHIGDVVEQVIEE